MANPAWVVTAVEPRPDYTLHLTFEDGKKKSVRFQALFIYSVISKIA